MPGPRLIRSDQQGNLFFELHECFLHEVMEGQTNTPGTNTGHSQNTCPDA